MKVWIRLFVAVAVLGLGYVAGAHLSGGAWPTPGLPVGGDRGLLRRQSMDFWEDIAFKDFDAAARHHAPDRVATVDIPYLLERIFMQKPELVDIRRVEIVRVDTDSSGDRGRVRCRLLMDDLAGKGTREQDILLFWHRDSAAAPWYLELETSLRALKGEEGKTF